MSELIPEDYTGFTPMTLADLRALIKGQRWIYAKTMPQCPHFYALRKHFKLDRDFVQFVKHIRKFGYDQRWHRLLHRYLDVDGWRYWTMGYQIESTILINRAKNDPEVDAGLFDLTEPERRHDDLNPKHFMAKRWNGEMYRP